MFAKGKQMVSVISVSTIHKNTVKYISYFHFCVVVLSFVNSLTFLIFIVFKKSLKDCIYFESMDDFKLNINIVFLFFSFHFLIYFVQTHKTISYNSYDIQEFLPGRNF